MHRSKAFFKKTRKGKILRVVSDHYLRDDIGCGSIAGKPVSMVRNARPEWYLVQTLDADLRAFALV